MWVGGWGLFGFYGWVSQPKSFGCWLRIWAWQFEQCHISGTVWCIHFSGNWQDERGWSHFSPIFAFVIFKVRRRLGNAKESGKNKSFGIESQYFIFSFYINTVLCLLTYCSTITNCRWLLSPYRSRLRLNALWVLACLLTCLPACLLPCLPACLPACLLGLRKR